jgi:tetratricopeptide (TPR) repeat protein
VDEILKQLQPYVSIIGAVASLSILVFLVHLLNVIRAAMTEQVNAVKSQKEITEERLKKSEEDLERTEKWHERELGALKERLSEVLGARNLDVSELVSSGGRVELESAVRDAVGALASEMRVLREQLTGSPRVQEDPQVLLTMAGGFAASENWAAAAQYYELYLKVDNSNWEVHFLRAVAFANSRAGREANIEALRSLNDAIALAPDDLDNDMRGRLYGYRGANLKRLSRFDEAEHDLLFARRLARATYETQDIRYNLACVYALTRRRDDMLRELRTLAEDPRWRVVVQTKRQYFENYWNDPQFKLLICPETVVTGT